MSEVKNPWNLLSFRLMSICIAMLICLSASFAEARQVHDANGSVKGAVVARDSEGTLSSVPFAKVSLSGLAISQTESDEQGKYTFVGVRPGKYIIKASSSGFEAERIVIVTADQTSVIDLELKPSEVKDSVTVTAEEPETGQAAPAGSVGERTLRDVPNTNERFESALPLIPGVVRGPDGRVNLEGSGKTHSGSLVNSANVTDPVTGGPAINLPIDVVASVQVISNPYDPQYSKFTGAVSTVATKTGSYDKFHFSLQNIVPRLRDRDGTIAGIGAATPRLTFSGPLVKDRIAITQSFEYRFVRTPVNSLPPLERDTKLESFDSYTQLDFVLTPKQTATVSFALYPQKLDYLGLNTFNTQESTPDFHQRGFQTYVQHRYVVGSAGLLTSQFSY